MLTKLTLLCGILPFIAVHIAYLLSANAGHVPWCNPYWDSCTSISATGREPPGYWWFKASMIPSAFLMGLFWHQFSDWLKEQAIGKARLIRYLGVIACACLAMYVIALGEAGDSYRWLRRIGATLYFTLTFLAQLLVGAWLWRHRHQTYSSKALLILSTMTLSIGIVSLLIDASTNWHDDVEDAFEWVLALLLNTWFLVLALHIRTRQTAS